MDKTVEIKFPYKGLDESQPLYRQSADTTPDCQNVRPWNARNGRDQGASRPGLTKLLEDRAQINGSYSIQEIIQISLTQASSFGEGSIFIPGGSTGWKILDNDGDAVHTQTSFSNWTAVFDDLGDYYVGFGDATSPDYTVPLVVRKYRRFTGELVWEKTLDDTTGVLQRVLGMALHKGVLYVYAGEDVDSATTTVSPSAVTKLYRVDASNGDDVGSNPWLTSAASLLAHATLGTGSVFVENSVNTHLAVGNAKLCIATYNATDNDARAQIINLADGVIDTTVDLKTGDEYGVSDVQGDASDNFYIAFADNTASVVGAAPVSDTLRKINSAGSTVWSYTGSTRIYGVAYDRHRDVIAICGDALGGSAGVNVGILSSAGSLTDSATLNGGAVCRCIRSDGRTNFVAFFGSGVSIKVDANLDVIWTQTHTSHGAYKSACCHGWETVGPSRRTTRRIAVAGGLLTGFDAVGTIAASSGSTAASPSVQVVMAAQVGPRIYWADGTIPSKRYNPISHAVESYTASSGTIPQNGTDGPRLCESWRGRLVYSGIRSDPQNWFMAAVNDPRNWHYSPGTTVSTQAVAGNDPDVGQSPDIVNCMIPYSNTEFWLGCDHSIVKFTGDPAAGGRIEVVNDTIGMAFGRPWCRDASGILYFVSSRGAVYRMSPAGGLDRLSTAIDKRLSDIDVGQHIYRTAWNDDFEGLHVFITPTDRRKPATHYWWDSKTGSWWPDVFAQPDFNPKCCYTLDGDDPEDRVVALGSWDGYLRTIKATAKDDDGQPISSRVVLMPLSMKNATGFTLKDLRMILDRDSEQIQWAARAGHSSQDALDHAVQQTGVFRAGRNHSAGVRVFGHAVYIELSQSALASAWAMECLHADLMPSGPTRTRTFT